jgi:hypothetical protein
VFCCFHVVPATSLIWFLWQILPESENAITIEEWNHRYFAKTLYFGNVEQTFRKRRPWSGRRRRRRQTSRNEYLLFSSEYTRFSRGELLSQIPRVNRVKTSRKLNYV